MLICLSHALYRIGITTIKDSKNDSTKLTRTNLLNQRFHSLLEIGLLEHLYHKKL